MKTILILMILSIMSCSEINKNIEIISIENKILSEEENKLIWDDRPENFIDLYNKIDNPIIVCKELKPKKYEAVIYINTVNAATFKGSVKIENDKALLSLYENFKEGEANSLESVVRVTIILSGDLNDDKLILHDITRATGDVISIQ